jgi:hypothetical protein
MVALGLVLLTRSIPLFKMANFQYRRGVLTLVSAECPALLSIPVGGVSTNPSADIE